MTYATRWRHLLPLIAYVASSAALHHEHAGLRPLSAIQDHELPAQYNDHRFRHRIDKALKSVKKILASTRNPTYADATPHVYDDKYGLADFLTSTSIAAQFNVLESLGLSRVALLKLVKAAKAGHAVTMRLVSSERTEFIREATRDVADSRVHKHASIFGTSESQMVTRVAERFWRHEATYELIAFVGINATASSTVTLQRRTASTQLVTTTRESPQPERREAPYLDVPLTWLLEQLEVPSLQVRFQIDRTTAACRTPRRNPQVHAALASATSLHHWATSVHNHFAERAARAAHPTHRLDLGAISERASALFVPVLPLFEQAEANSSGEWHAGVASGAASGGGAASVAAATCSRSALLPGLADVHAFLSEQRRSLQAAGEALDASFPSGVDGGAFVSAAEGRLCMHSRHLRDVLTQYADGVDYLEDMLRRQLSAAIGKQLSAADFAQFMTHHEARLYRTAFAPQPFTFAVRRPGHS